MVTDIAAIAAMGVMMTPSSALDGKVKSAGRVFTRDEVAQYIKGGR